MDKKILPSALLGFLALPALAMAQLRDYGGGTDITSLVHSAEKLAGLVFGAIAVICFVIAGVLFLTAQGDAEKIKTARYAVIWGFAGVIIGIVAFSIIAIVSAFIR